MGFPMARKNYDPPQLAAPEPRQDWPGTWETFRAARENTVTLFPDKAYRELIVARNIGGRIFLLVNDPDCVGDVLLKRSQNYPKGQTGLRLLGPALGRGIFTSDGTDWKRQRHAAAPAFQFKRLVEFVPALADETRGLTERWAAIGSRRNADVQVDVNAEMMDLTLRIICRTMFSSTDAAETEDVASALELYLSTAGRLSLHTFLRLPEWVPNPALWRARPATSYLRQLVRRVITQRRKSGEQKGDLLDMLLTARDEDGREGMSEVELEDNLITFLAAGHETTANALTWAFYLLSLHPEVAVRVANEVWEVCGIGDPTADNYKDLIYTRMVIEEAMRLYPPVPVIDREARQPDELDGYPVPKGTFIMIAPWVLHRHEKLWSQPCRFNPDRFDPRFSDARHRFQYLPFGGGQRICIGAAFAMMEAVIALAMIVRQFDMTVAAEHVVAPIGHVTLRPKGGLPMHVSSRPTMQ